MKDFWKENNLRFKDKKYRNAVVTGFVVLITLVLVAPGLLSSWTLDDNSFSLTDNGGITTEYVNASGSDGLKLLNDGGTGIEIKDNGDVNYDFDGQFVVGDGGHATSNKGLFATSDNLRNDIGMTGYSGTNNEINMFQAYGYRGTQSNKWAVQAGDVIYQHRLYGYDNSTLDECGGYRFVVNDTYTTDDPQVGVKYRLRVYDEAEGGDTSMTYYYADNSVSGGAVFSVEGKVTGDDSDFTSDERVKDFLGEIPVAAVKDFCNDIVIQKFIWKDYDINESGILSIGENTGVRGIGTSAQDLYNYTSDRFGEQWAEAVVRKGDENTIWKVNYNTLNLMFARYTQVLQDEIDSLDARVSALENP